MAKKITNYYNSFSKKIRLLIDKANFSEHTFMLVIAVILGSLAGLGAVGMLEAIHALSHFIFQGEGTLLEGMAASPWFLRIASPTFGGILVGLIIYYVAKRIRGYDVTFVMRSVLREGGMIHPQVPFAKTIVSIITMATGASAGKEGPSVILGSGIASMIGQFLHVPANRMKTFVACGAAGGIAAAFNAPIAGALFALEIILGEFTVAQFSPIVISSVMATVVSRSIIGNFAEFQVQVPPYQLQGMHEFVFYIILGFFCGFVAYLYIKTYYATEDFFNEKVRLPMAVKPAIGAFIVGIMAIYFPHVMGIGHDTVTLALEGKLLLHVAFLLILAKIIATAITIGSGGSGGKFFPALYIGSVAGCFFGLAINNVFPDLTASPSAYALVAMGGVLAGTIHAPLTAIIIVFEITNDYHTILPLMVTCIISMVVSTKLSRESIYTLKLVRQGIHLKDGLEINIMKSIYVKDVLSTQFETINQRRKFNEIVNQVVSSNASYFPVVDDEKNLKGLISIHDIKDHLFERDNLRNVLIAKDIAIEEIKGVSLDDTCQRALERMAEHDLEALPVVSNRKSGDTVVGMIWRKHIQEAYNKEVEERDLSASIANRLTSVSMDKEIHFLEGYSITEVPAPSSFVGKTILELNIRARYGVSIILIHSTSPNKAKSKIVPDPRYRIMTGDTLIISGEIGRIQRFKALL